jgi:RES domain-containing protein
MIIWRISNYADISGVGGIKFAARWHNKGAAIVYTTEHPALAMLEILVHSNRSNLPDSYKLLEIFVPDQLEIEPPQVLKSRWQNDEAYTRALGDKWLQDKLSPIMQVPSVIMPNSFNYLINPEHPQSKHIKIYGTGIHLFDSRLKF